MTILNKHISNRIKSIANHIPKGSFFADIGSDHALLPCYICYYDKYARAIAGEVQKGPYERAIENVKHYRLNEQIDVRLGDGLQVVDERVDVIVIAGMGGKLISHILQQDIQKLVNVNKLILQPNNNAPILRKTLLNMNFHLSSEMIIEENDQIYEILVADKSTMNPYNDNIEKQMMFGPYLLKNKNTTFIKYWRSEHKNLKNIINNIRQSKSNQDSNLKDFENKLTLIEEVLNE